MAGTGHIRLASLLYALKRPRPADRRVMRAIRGPNQFLEFIVETFLAEVALFFGDPFLQAKVRLDDEF